MHHEIRLGSSTYKLDTSTDKTLVICTNESILNNYVQAITVAIDRLSDNKLILISESQYIAFEELDKTLSNNYTFVCTPIVSHWLQVALDDGLQLSDRNWILSEVYSKKNHNSDFYERHNFNVVNLVHNIGWSQDIYFTV